MPGATRRPLLDFLRRIDYLQLGVVSLLLGIGLVFIRSTGLQVDSEVSRSFYGKQWMWISAGWAAYILIAALDYRSFSCRVAVFAGYALSLILLALALAAGTRVFGATRWLNVGGFRLQPSEPAKLMVIGVIAAVFSAPYLQGRKLLQLLIAVLTVAAPFVLIAAEPDLGSALVLLPVAAAMIFCFGIKWRYVLLGALAIAILTGFMVMEGMRKDPLLLRNYQSDRIKVFLNPGMDKGNRGHNAYQAQLAVGAGGVSGAGIGRGTQNELGFLPHTVSNNDFIFSVIAEETGFTGVMGLLVLYALLLYSVLRTAFLASGYGRHIAVGVAALLFCHIFINIGMSIGITPVTGLPLPLVSYGGSFTLTSMVTMGLVQSIYRGAKRDLEEEARR